MIGLFEWSKQHTLLLSSVGSILLLLVGSRLNAWNQYRYQVRIQKEQEAKLKAQTDFDEEVLHQLRVWNSGEPGSTSNRVLKSRIATIPELQEHFKDRDELSLYESLTRLQSRGRVRPVAIGTFATGPVMGWFPI